jgi:versiconal hemiacetal acetate reductase
MGKVRYIGASSMYAYQFLGLQNVAECNGWTKFISMQNYYNLIYREEEREMLPACKESGVGYYSSPLETELTRFRVIPWSPVARGALAKRRGESSLRSETDTVLHALVTNNQRESEKDIIDRVEEIAKKKEISMAQVATAWLLSKDGAIPFVNKVINLGSGFGADCGVEFRGTYQGDG